MDSQTTKLIIIIVLAILLVISIILSTIFSYIFYRKYKKSQNTLIDKNQLEILKKDIEIAILTNIDKTKTNLENKFDILETVF
ncbi:hypothetical protein [Mycoplasmopsis alligatoris]|uniref:Conserved domain protein n=1 Tax=Mycoplasmopsis alligatoris A21JP2 TaxID=747682 RepID=D4XW98_9BACT|nr:hypothetical protein [Mycoplasmopsis alligatoris]EFF41376.1 conserved domain protein [Mycoplasmopsis alligatoris A21JP2]